MSTYFYGYRMRKDQLWSVHAAIRSYYLSIHPAAQAAMFTGIAPYRKLLAGDPDAGFFPDMSAVQDLFCKKRDYAACMQVFEINNTYIFRILSDFWLDEIPSEFAKWLDIQEFSYDDREDVPESKRQYLSTVNQLGERTGKAEYFLMQLVSRYDMGMIIIDVSGALLDRARATGLLKRNTVPAP